MSLDKCRGIYHPFLMGLLTNGRILQLGSSAGDGDIDLKLTRYLAVIALVMELLSTNRTISLRDVYYKLKYLFSDQSESNAIILDLGKLLNMHRHQMKIVPAAKGFISGPIAFRFLDDASSERLKNGDWVNCEDGGPSLDRQLISSQWTNFNRFGEEESLQIVSSRQDMQLEHIRYLIVVEKEGIFHRLVEDKFTRCVPCILVTGCGFPDFATRACVSRISRACPWLTVIGLCDYNSYGLSLLLTYRFPTMSSEFEGQDMQVPQMKWLGLRSKHIDEFLEKCTAQVDGRDEFSTALQKMTAHDHRETCRLVSRFKTTNLLPEYAMEIEAMLSGGVKCELESVFIFGFGFLLSFLERCLLIHDYI